MAIQIFAHAFENVFLSDLPERVHQLRDALEKLHQGDPDRQVIILHEVAAISVHPFVSLP